MTNRRITIVIILVVCVLGGGGLGYGAWSKIGQWKAAKDEVIKEQRTAIELQKMQIRDLSREVEAALAALRLEQEAVEDYKSENVLLLAEIDDLTFEHGEDMQYPLQPHEPFNFDCDDSALYMYLFFVARGYDVDIILGNLELENESISQTNHVWLMVALPEEGSGFPYNLTGFYRPYDWGACKRGEQYLEGYEITYKELLRYAWLDQ